MNDYGDRVSVRLTIPRLVLVSCGGTSWRSPVFIFGGPDLEERTVHVCEMPSM